MYDMNVLIASSKRIRDSIWSADFDTPSRSAREWWKGSDGVDALARFLRCMYEAATDAERLLVMAIYAMRVEIAARRAGWCPEMER